MARPLVLSALLVAVAVAALLPAAECSVVKKFFHKAEHGVHNGLSHVGHGLSKGAHDVEHAVKKTAYTAAAATGLAAGAVYGTVSTAGHYVKKGVENLVDKGRNKLADKIAVHH
ncbi:hypothetical protein ONE63_004848 [Megalurothrips usitatus]|uniref:Uncharacterized protein n=1 Tax=Megalurothrips usitatus TaxID=439358 RepID=A0AAV7X478_9NEOP|nr:hypothetical protein ONE63_004848 [Megalurothrips usitatus]